MRTLILRAPHMRGADVSAAQRRLPGVPADSEYGLATAAAAYAWKWRTGFRRAEVNTGLGQRAQLILLGKVALTPQMRERARARAGHIAPPLPTPAPRPATHRELIVDEANWLLEHRWNYVYANVRPISPYDLRAVANRDRLDCSSTVTCCYHAGGAPDPNGRNYDGEGFTGTLWAHGSATSKPIPGDLAFYGNMGAVFGYCPSHVAIHDDDPDFVISFGHTPPTRYPVGYRSGDYRGSRTYQT